MDQPKISRMLRLMVLMSGRRLYSIQQLAEELGASERTVYRYIDTFKEAGFAVEKVYDYQYRLLSVGGGVRDLSRIVYFSPEEAFIVNRLIDSLDPSNALKEELKRKLAAIYERTGVAELGRRPTTAEKVQALADAIRDRKVVRIDGYASSYSGKTKDYRVEPFEFTPNYAGVWAYDLADGRNKRFKVLRMEGVEKTDEPWSMAHAHHATPMDAFRIHGETEYHVILRMNNVAKNLMVEEFPLTEPDIFPQDAGLEDGLMQLGEALVLPGHDMESEDEQFWIYDGMVRGLDGVGRFVLGLEGNIEVLEGDELIQYLLDHARSIRETYGE